MAKQIAYAGQHSEFIEKPLAVESARSRCRLSGVVLCCTPRVSRRGRTWSLATSSVLIYAGTASHQAKFAEATDCPAGVCFRLRQSFAAVVVHGGRDFCSFQDHVGAFGFLSVCLADSQRHFSIPRLFHLLCGDGRLLHLVGFVFMTWLEIAAAIAGHRSKKALELTNATLPVYSVFPPQSVKSANRPVAGCDFVNRDSQRFYCTPTS